MSTNIKEVVGTNEVQVDYTHLLNFVNAAGMYVKEHQKERSKLTYALEKLTGKYKSKIEAYNEFIRDKRVEFASVDEETGNIVESEFSKGTPYATTRYAYTPEKAKLLDRAIREINNTEVTVPIHHLDIPDGIDPIYVRLFTPFIFSEMTEEEELEWYLNSQDTPVKKLAVNS